MPIYRLIFPAPLDQSIESTHTSEIDSGNQIYKVGDEIEHEGKRWRVSKAPTEDPMPFQVLDLMIWPVE